MNIILIGPPGSGKGTQAKKIAKEYGMKHISTGDLLREEIQKNTETGKKINELLKEGKLVPNSTVLELLKQHLNKEGIVFDGYPRNVDQAIALDEMTNIDLVIEIKVPDEEVKKRMLNRKEGRSDDNEETIKKRLEVYHDLVEPLVEYYKPRHITHTVDGTPPPQQVFEEIKHIIDNQP